MPILAVDYGFRYIGLAITDVDDRLAVRYGSIDQKKVEGLSEIQRIVERENIHTVLIGVPYSLSGNRTAQTDECEAFMKAVTNALPATVQVLPTDETLTSVAAEQQVQWEGGPTVEAHAEAARIMLEDYLRQRSQERREK